MTGLVLEWLAFCKMDFTIPSYVYMAIQKAYLFILCVCVMCGIYICIFMGGHMCATSCVWWSKGQWCMSLLTFLQCFETGSLLLCKLGYLTFRSLISSTAPGRTPWEYRHWSCYVHFCLGFWAQVICFEWQDWAIVPALFMLLSQPGSTHPFQAT